MRVYLMADFGKGPLCVRHFAALNASADSPEHCRYIAQAQSALGSLADSVLSGANDQARSWWLIEAESADAARACIAQYESPTGLDYSRRQRDEAAGRWRVLAASKAWRRCASCGGSGRVPVPPGEGWNGRECNDCSGIGRILASGGAK